MGHLIFATILENLQIAMDIFKKNHSDLSSEEKVWGSCSEQMG